MRAVSSIQRRAPVERSGAANGRARPDAPAWGTRGGPSPARVGPSLPSGRPDASRGGQARMTGKRGRLWTSARWCYAQVAITVDALGTLAKGAPLPGASGRRPSTGGEGGADGRWSSSPARGPKHPPGCLAHARRHVGPRDAWRRGRSLDRRRHGCSRPHRTGTMSSRRRTGQKPAPFGRTERWQHPLQARAKRALPVPSGRVARRLRYASRPARPSAPPSVASPATGAGGPPGPWPRR